MSVDGTASRFFRPADVARLRRNQKQIQMQRLLVILRSAVLLIVLIGGGAWIWSHTRSGARFAVRRIDVQGAVHTPLAAIERVTHRYEGMNLFQIDINRVQGDLGGLGWVRRIDIEKSLPDTLRIKITERVPVALVRSGQRLLYVDEEGTGFAELSPAAGNDELPIIDGATGDELRRSVVLLQTLRKSDPAVYARISEVRPIPPHGFALFDRDLDALVYANGDDVVSKWRNLYAILDAEGRPAIEYADLRFSDRIVVKVKRIAPVRAETHEQSEPPPPALPEWVVRPRAG